MIRFHRAKVLPLDPDEDYIGTFVGFYDSEGTLVDQMVINVRGDAWPSRRQLEAWGVGNRDEAVEEGYLDDDFPFETETSYFVARRTADTMRNFLKEEKRRRSLKKNKFNKETQVN